MTLAGTLNTADSYSQQPPDRIHAFQILADTTLLGYIWFGEYEPANAAGTLAAIDAGEAGQRAALYWAHRLQTMKAAGKSASDAVLDLRDEPETADHGHIEQLPITVRALATLQERANPPAGIARVIARRDELFTKH